MNSIQSLFKHSALTLITISLLACGGGGGDAEPISPVTPPVITLSKAQGFWSATPSANTSVNAVILPNGQAWVIYQTGSAVTALAQSTLSLSGSTFTGVGKHYSLPAGVVQDFNLSATQGSTSAATTPTLINTTTVGASTPMSLTWTYNKSFETAVTQASVQGRWSSLQGAISLTWDIDANGKLAGTSTTGCTYSGTLTPNTSPIAVLDVSITESCAGTLKALSGIATLNTAKTGISVAYTTTNGAQGGVVVLQK